MDPLIDDLVLHAIHLVQLQALAALPQTVAAPPVLLGPCCWYLLMTFPTPLLLLQGRPLARCCRPCCAAWPLLLMPMQSLPLQGILYKPIGLSCGHKFCRPCALRAAGMSKVLGKVKAILENIPAETKCPECRQMWVYSGAIQLKSVDEFVRSR